MDKQEPIAWMVYTLDGTSVCVTDNPTDFTENHRALPLYTTPQPQEFVCSTDKEKLAQWMIQRGYATGHGDTVEDLLNELDWQIAENWARGMVNGVHAEREACAKLVEILIPEQTEEGLIGHTIAKAIRARGEQ